MKPYFERFFNLIDERGWKGRIVPIDHLIDLQEAIRSYHKRGLFDETFYQRQISFFSFKPPKELPDARSIIIVGVPTPQMRIIFHWKGKPISVIVPPTYVSYTPRTENVHSILAVWLKQEGYQLAKPQLPLKTLAVSSGLAEFGRNNICYIPGMGSFLQLVGAFSDLPCDDDPWRELKALDLCKTCIACVRHCPTKAITNDRFLLRAERCLTYHNEAEADFPDWIDQSWHHCLIGCLRCQTCCPENKSVLDWVEDRAEFSDHETELLIQHVPLGRLPVETATKLQSLEINEDYRLLCRNLSIIIKRESVSS